MQTIKYSDLEQHDSYRRIMKLAEIVRPVANRFGEENVLFYLEEHGAVVDLTVQSPSGELYEQTLSLRRYQHRIDGAGVQVADQQSRVQKYIEQLIKENSQAPNR